MLTVETAKVGTIVQTYHDRGARGRGRDVGITFGVITKAGPKQCEVKWESGAISRVRFDNAGGLTVTEAWLVEAERASLTRNGLLPPLAAQPRKSST